MKVAPVFAEAVYRCDRGIQQEPLAGDLPRQVPESPREAPERNLDSVLSKPTGVPFVGGGVLVGVGHFRAGDERV